MTSQFPHDKLKARVRSICKKTATPEPLALLRKPTALETRKDISNDLGISVLVKREDMTDEIGSGHKLRKLAYVMADAVARNSTVLVTAGSLPSNQCKAVAALSRRHGMRAHIAYGGDRQRRPPIANGNYLLTTLCEPTISWFESTPWSMIPGLLDQIASNEALAGERPYVIEPGISNWPGLLGSVELGFELALQLEERSLSRCHIIAVAGSGGTCTGLAIAAALLNKAWTVTGICIGEPPENLQQRAIGLVNEFSTRTALLPDIHSILSFSDVALGGGYDAASDTEFDAMGAALRRYGLLLDPNYMCKAYLGMSSLVASGRIRDGVIVLIHSGGQAGIFDAGVSALEWHRTRYKTALS